jgi:hypothetical protein
VHRFGSYLNSHVHFHVIVTDGVFSGGDGGSAVIHPALDLDQDDHLTVQKKMRHRGLRWLHRHGHLDDLAVHTLDAPDHAGGWSVDASVTIPAWDRHGLGRLARYRARPALSQERLGRVNDEMLVYSLKRPAVDGRTELYLTPLELLDRLAALITPPRIHKHRYCGVLAPNAPRRLCDGRQLCWRPLAAGGDRVGRAGGRDAAGVAGSAAADGAGGGCPSGRGAQAPAQSSGRQMLGPAADPHL